MENFKKLFSAKLDQDLTQLNSMKSDQKIGNPTLQRNPSFNSSKLVKSGVKRGRTTMGVQSGRFGTESKDRSGSRVGMPRVSNQGTFGNLGRVPRVG